jgi:hypothetical protein
MCNVLFNAEKVRVGSMFFISASNENKMPIGFIRLSLLWYFADFDHYEKYGVGITGMTYTKEAAGPRPRELKSVLARMLRDGTITIDDKNQFTFVGWDGSPWVDEPDYQI